MRIKIITAISLLLTILSLTGCQPADSMLTSDYLITTPKQNNITINQLARRLDLKISNISSTDITLKNSSDTVLIFTHTDGRFFVNGNPVDYVGPVSNIDGQIYLPESLIPKIRSALQTRAIRLITVTGTVVIDAGHGGKDPGAIGINGYYEKNLNLKIAKKVIWLLKQRGVKVIATRTNDIFIELNRRADIANRYSPDLFVSIHADSAFNHSARGFTVYVAKSASARSNYAAKAITNAMSTSGLKNRGVRKGDYIVLVRTKCPAVLVEMGYLSNRTEASLLLDQGFQNRIAKTIADGIARYLRRSFN